MKNRIVPHTRISRLIVFLVTLGICFTLCQSIAFAESKEVTVKLNGQMLEFDQKPIIENGRTLVPLRKIFESLNAFVEWDDETQTVTAKKHSTEISLKIGNNIAKVSGEEYTLDVPAKVVNGRTLVPVRFIAEALNCKVDWDDDSYTVIIRSEMNVQNGNNLFDKEKAKSGNYITLDGKIGNNPIYSYSDYIKVTPGQVLYFLSSRLACTVGFVTAYDADKNVIKDSGKSYVKEYIVPTGVEWVRISVDNTYTNWLEVRVNNNLDGFINKEICVADGKKITIYKEQLISQKRDDISFIWECPIGREINGNYEIDANGNLGNYPLKVTVADLSGNAIWTGNSTVKIVKNELPEFKLLAIGDSLTNGKLWQNKLADMSAGKITFVGTRGNKIKHEGRSGFTSGEYMKETEYTFEKEGIHPFWDGERFNWNFYKKTTGVNPDVIQIFLGINDIKTNPENNAANIVKMVDYIKNDDPSIPIFVVNTMYKGPLSKSEEHVKVFNLMEKLCLKLESYENVFIIPVAITHDSNNNYTEEDQIHPMNSGYEQIADVIYSSMCAHLK